MMEVTAGASFTKPVGLAGIRPWARPLAWTAVTFELTGVLVVGTLTVLDTGDFPDDTVWSVYGRGYGFVPLVLPLIGLWWLRRTGRRTDGAGDVTAR